MSALHLEVSGRGVPAIFVHGSFGTGATTFPGQRALADDWQVVLVDRRGFGGSTFASAEGWPADMPDLAGLLDELGPAHVVGHSYGAVVALLAAGLRPGRIRSLVAIEPPAFELATDDADARRAAAALKPVADAAPRLTAEEFADAWAHAQGRTRDELGCDDWAVVDATRRQRWPGDAPIRLDVLREAPFPLVLARGAWRPEVVGREGAGREYAAVCARIAAATGARTVVFERSGHSPQLQEPEAFDALLRETWRSDV